MSLQISRPAAPFLKHAIPILASVLTMLSLSATGSVSLDRAMLEDLALEIQGNTPSSVTVSIFITAFYIHYWPEFKKHRNRKTGVIAGLFALFCVFGISYASSDSWNFIFASLGQFAISILVALGFFILFDIAITILFQLLDKYAVKSLFMTPTIQQTIVISRPFTFAFICILVAWLPYLVLHLPGSVPYDGYRQINMGLGYEPISQHHPWIVSFFFASIMRVGQLISDNFGVFLVALSLFTLQAACYALVCRNLSKIGTSIWIYFFSLAFFALVPAFGAYSQSVMKDGMYSALFAVWFSEYINLFFRTMHNKPIFFSDVISLLLFALMVSLWRNNGLHIVTLAQLLFVLFHPKSEDRHTTKRFVIIGTLILLAIYFALNSLIAPALGVLPGSIKEALSVPFQQTARFLRDYPNDVTESEESSIEAILDYQQLGDRYNPERSDPVKDSFDNNSTTADLLRYLSAWFSMGLRHPNAYIQATLNNVFGYFYPGYNYTELGPYQFYIQGEPVATGDLSIHYIVPDYLRGICDGWALLWRNFPPLCLLVNPAFYTWFIIFCTGYLVHRDKSSAILPIIPLFLNVLVCCISPVNGYLRYALPLMACSPTLLCWVAYICNEAKQKSRQSEPRFHIKSKEQNYRAV